MNKKYKSLLVLFSCLSVFGQQMNKPSLEITEKISKYTAIENPQKLFLHFDKDRYFAGENIWFKTYLLDAVNHLPDTSTSNLWVELINSQGELVDIRLFQPQNGFAWGNFALSDSIPDGNYFVRAYTDWMRNLNSEFHFTKQFYIQNPKYSNYISTNTIRSNKRFNSLFKKKEQEINMDFFPEGGNLVAGINNRVAFKATDGLGRGVEVKGSLVNNKGQVISEINTRFAGIGYFELKPVPGELYKVVFNDKDKKKRKLPFIKPLAEGYSLRIETGPDSLSLTVQSNVSSLNSMYSEKLIIVAHTRGTIHYGEPITLENGHFSKLLSKRLFPSGITHFTIFLPDYRPIAERLVFIDHNDQLILSSNILAEPEEGQNKLTVLFNTIHPRQGPVEGSFSVSVITTPEIPYVQTDNILSYLLMSSDLVGIVENPADLFSSVEDANEHLDLLMLTHGWRRFAWDKIITGVFAKPNFLKNYGISIKGVVIDPANNKPVRNHPVQLRILSGHNDVFVQKTNNEGEFVFSNLKYNDLVKIELTAGRLTGGTLPFIKVSSEDKSDFKYLKSIFTESQLITDTGKDWKKPSKKNFAASDDSSSGETQSIYGSPDQTIYVDERLTNYRSLIDVLSERATGISVVQGQIRLRGTSSFYGSNEPIFFIDGTQVDSRTFAMVSPKEVHRIDIFKGASAAMFGVRGTNGAILAYTKRHANIGHKEFYDFLIVGYHTPREFYNDFVSMDKNMNSTVNPVQTIYWEPNLRTDQNGKAQYYIPIIKDVKNLKVIIQGIGLKGGIGFGEYEVKLEE